MITGNQDISQASASNRTSTSYQTGTCEGNCQFGWGKMTYANGDIHLGEWRNGIPHGWGQKLKPQLGRLTAGFFIKGQLNYFGAWFQTNQRFGIGAVENGKFTGSGLEYSWDTPDFLTSPPQWEAIMEAEGFTQNGIGLAMTDNYLRLGHFEDGKLKYTGIKILPNGGFALGVFDWGALFTGFEISTEPLTEDGKKVRSYTEEVTRFEDIPVGCVSGNCEDGFGLMITEEGQMTMGFFVAGQLNGFAMYAELDGPWSLGLWDDGAPIDFMFASSQEQLDFRNSYSGDFSELFE